MSNRLKEEKTSKPAGFGSNIRQFCSFRLADRLYGIDILEVKEVNPETDFTPIYHAREEILGYVNIRGQIHLVLDLRRLLRLPPVEPNESSRVMIFKPDVGESFGVLVDEVGDVVEVDEEDIQDRRKSDQGNTEGEDRRKHGDLSGGVSLLENELMVILNAKNFLNYLEN